MGRAGAGGMGGGRAGGGMGGRAGGGHGPGGMGGGRPMGGGAPMGGGRRAPMGGGFGAPPPPRRHYNPLGAAMVGAAIGAAFAPRHRCPPPPYGYRYSTTYTYDECVAVLNALYNVRDCVDSPQDRFVLRQYFGRDVMPGEAPGLIAWMEDYLR